MAFVEVRGFKEIDEILRNYPREISREAIIKAGRKAAKPIVVEARRNVAEGNYKGAYSSKRDPKLNKPETGNLNGFEHLRALTKLTKITIYKGGVNVQIDPKAPDLPMASSRPFWHAYGVAKLFAKGRQNSGKGNRDKNTGYTHGFGDWVEEAAEDVMWTTQNIYKREVLEELKKARNRVIAKYGFKGYSNL